MTRLALCGGCMKRHIPIDSPNRRCDDCRRQLNRTKYRRRRRTAAERRRRRSLIAEHVRVHGWTCPGWNRPAHPSTDPTADHLTPQARGGAPESAIRVLWRSCNAARGAGSRESSPASAVTADNDGPLVG
jgi:5-methylcytosine-specific restriction enzyme A